MKKTFKIICAILACAVLTCPLFAGCANSDGQYVQNSFKYQIESRVSAVYVDGSFEILLDAEGSYTVEYDIDLFFGYNKQLVASQHGGMTVTATESETKKISVYKSFIVTWNTNGIATKEEYTAKIYNVIITKEQSYDISKDYAIGFGVTAAVLTGAVIAFFVITETAAKRKSKQKNDADQAE